MRNVFLEGNSNLLNPLFSGILLCRKKKKREALPLVHFFMQGFDSLGQHDPGGKDKEAAGSV